MDLWKYFDITHREHVLCNPTNVEKIDELITLLRMEPGAKVLEIATGKGEFIIRLAERYKIEGIGVDISPYHISDAEKKSKARIPDAHLTFLEIVQTGDIVDKRSETSLTLYRIRHEGEHLPCHGKRVQQWKNESGSSRKQK